MKNHEEIDRRSLALAQAVGCKIDADPSHAGLEKARALCRRWYDRQETEACREWLAVLSRPWSEVRAVLLDEGERGRRLRQSAPFCGILTPRERWAIYRQWCQARRVVRPRLTR